jgi:hypothetical protein
MARTVSQVRVDVARLYRRKLARFSPNDASLSREIDVSGPTATGQNHKFISRPNR